MPEKSVTKSMKMTHPNIYTKKYGANVRMHIKFSILSFSFILVRPLKWSAFSVFCRIFSEYWSISK